MKLIEYVSGAISRIPGWASIVRHRISHGACNFVNLQFLFGQLESIRR